MASWSPGEAPPSAPTLQRYALAIAAVVARAVKARRRSA
jgi:hypothetical protein